MDHPVRKTKKTRMVGDFADSIVDLHKEGFIAMSKSQIVSGVVISSTKEEASTAVKTLLEDELANELERYFRDAVKEAASIIKRPYHMVTVKYFKERHKHSKYSMQEKVSVFGASNGKSAGVRFVPEGVTNDPMLLLTLEKRMDNSANVANAVKTKVRKDIESGAVTPEQAAVMNDRLGQQRIK